MRWPLRPLLGLTSFLAAPVALAQTPLPNCPPLIAPLYPNCQPGTTIPGFGTGTSGQQNPNDPQLPRSAQDALRDGSFSRSAEGGSQSAATAAPSMDGDIIGARAFRIRYRANILCSFNCQVGALTSTGGPGVFVNPNFPGSTIAFGTPNGNTRTLQSNFSQSDLTFVQPITLTSGPNPDFDRVFAQSALNSLFSKGGLTPQQQQQFNKLAPADRAKLLANRGAINAQITQATRGIAVPTVTVGAVDGNIVGNVINYTAVLTGERALAMPNSSTYVGRVKLSEDNSPLPTDRVFFGYDSFAGVPLTEDGLAVNRFMFGFEKTFLDGRWSAEVRLPFAGTLASSFTDGFETKDVELGNLRLSLKHRWTTSDTLNISSGVGVTVPTANDQVVFNPLGGELYRFQNESVTVEPFVALLYTPNDRFFAQGWTSINADTTGGRLTYNKEVFGGSGSERVFDLPYLALDGQIGYWVVKRNSGTIRGLAPFVELHWNYAIAQQQAIEAVNDSSQGQGLTISGVANTELNLTAGIVMQINDHVNLTLGGSAPLFRKPDRTFEGQFGLRLNYLFGASARSRVGGVTSY